jgi:hypothetical protein
LKTIKNILYSPRFLREVSSLLFFFAALSALIGVVALISSQPDVELLAMGIGGLLQGIVYAVLFFSQAWLHQRLMGGRELI